MISVDLHALATFTRLNTNALATMFLNLDPECNDNARDPDPELSFTAPCMSIALLCVKPMCCVRTQAAKSVDAQVCSHA
jgi:hypothetical protein